MTAQRKWQVKAQPQETKNTEQPENHVVTKAQFLTVLARLQDNAENGSRESSPTLILTSPVEFKLPPPPGLSLPVPPPLPELPKDLASSDGHLDLAQKELAEGNPTDPQSQSQGAGPYQVLIRGISEEQKVRALLQEANLDNDTLRLDFRPGGKALIEFITFASVRLCVSHFHGRPWGDGGACINALYVRTVKKDSTTPTCAPKSLSVNAPVFIPSGRLSAKATAFVPQKLDTIHEKRVCSDASTDAMSENGDSESNDGGPPDDPVQWRSLEMGVMPQKN